MRFCCLRSSLLVALMPLSMSLSIAPLAQAAGPTAAFVVDGTGMVIKDMRRLSPFQSLQLETAAKVVIRQGERELVEVIAEGNVAPLVDTYVEKRRLYIQDAKPFRSAQALVVVTVRQLDSIDTHGAVAVSANGLDLPLLALRLAGTSAVQLNDASFGRLQAALGGASTLKLSGTADELAAELGDTAALRAGGLTARAVSLLGGGSSQAALWATETLSISLGGSATAGFYGNVTPSLATSGTATVKHLGAAPDRP